MPRLRRIFTTSPGEWAYLARAIIGLARARIDFSRVSAQAILERLQEGELAARQASPALDLERLSWSIGAASRLVPWRSDCLIQSMAADRWLRGHGVLPSFKLGVATDQEGQILGHAWIEVEGRVITGGAAVETYSLLISSFPPAPIAPP